MPSISSMPGLQLFSAPHRCRGCLLPTRFLLEVGLDQLAEATRQGPLCLPSAQQEFEEGVEDPRVCVRQRGGPAALGG